MPDEEKIVQLLSLQERKEAIEEQLDWIDQMIAVEQYNHNRRMAYFFGQRETATKAMGDVIREEMRGRSE